MPSSSPWLRTLGLVLPLGACGHAPAAPAPVPVPSHVDPGPRWLDAHRVELLPDHVLDVRTGCVRRPWRHTTVERCGEEMEISCPDGDPLDAAACDTSRAQPGPLGGSAWAVRATGAEEAEEEAPTFCWALSGADVTSCVELPVLGFAPHLLGDPVLAALRERPTWFLPRPGRKSYEPVESTCYDWNVELDDLEGTVHLARAGVIRDERVTIQLPLDLDGYYVGWGWRSKWISTTVGCRFGLGRLRAIRATAIDFAHSALYGTRVACEQAVHDGSATPFGGCLAQRR